MEKLTKQQMALLVGGSEMVPCTWDDPDTGEEISGYCDNVDAEP